MADTESSQRPSDVNAHNHRETSFNSMDTIDHLFVTGDDRSSINRVSQLDNSKNSSIVASSVQDNSYIE